MIKELIVVEGKNDAEVVRRAFPQADIMITHGWGLSQSHILALQTANRRRGVIIFTDPDHAGERIRRRLSGLLPGCRHAFVPRERAVNKGKVGVEAASIEDIKAALARVRTEGPAGRTFDQQDLIQGGLTGIPQAAARRKRLGNLLAIGYGNSKNFLWRLNALGITRTEFEQALKQLEAE
ncbi:MAG: ribonuclease M5 [Eubacteriales bacterium]|nr:ribonuclease M5 [Eubacteriales bacterium]MDD3072825.1 ribonuclease M5 [Eubacteriales bacterium]MDD4078252.1 ribonuclease M5 [Eubacteriales bacterium]MDD4768967.1 ribonuclease M5 [Eubacteriales bacterium]